MLCLAGATATGKTSLSLELAEALCCELISVDSAMVYRGMDIGTAKPSVAERARITHHLIDIREPAEGYSAGDFRRDAQRLIAAIHRRGRLPLLVGGSMLYFHVLLEGLDELPPADPALRRRIDGIARHHGWPALHRRLRMVDPQTAAQLHPNHSQRLQRALEIYLLTGSPPSVLRGHRKGLGSRYPLLKLMLDAPDRPEHERRMAQRLQQMLRAGLVSETQGLLRSGALREGVPAARAVGYRQVLELLAGHIGAAELEASILTATKRLARRQRTWAQRWSGWLPVLAGDVRSARRLADRWLLAGGWR